MKNYIIIGVLALVLVLGIGFYIFNKNSSLLTENPDGVVCTMDAKQCPGGSYVGRSGPKCEFAKCPDVEESTQAKIALTIINNRLYITPREVLEDSRCPVDVTCISAGRVRLLVTIMNSEEGSLGQNINLVTGVPFDHKGRRIELVDVSPQTNSKKTINVNDYIFTFSVKDIVLAGNGSVSGKVTLSPTCLVERIPPDPQCAPRIYSTNIEIRQTGSDSILKTIKSDLEGDFFVELPSGTYELQPIGGPVFPKCSSTTVQILSGKKSVVNLSCDTGIR